MNRTDDLYRLPDDVAVPVDDGACDHLPGARIPSCPLPSTNGGPIDVAAIEGRAVLYIYPRTGTPERMSLVSEWDQIPGARGCTPQSCSFRDHHAELRALGVEVFGLSTQDTAYQREMAERVHLPFPILSDVELRFSKALALPTFTVAHTILLKRVTLIVGNATIEKVFYPVFPPDRSAQDVVDWLKH